MASKLDKKTTVKESVRGAMVVGKLVLKSIGPKSVVFTPRMHTFKGNHGVIADIAIDKQGFPEDDDFNLDFLNKNMAEVRNAINQEFETKLFNADEEDEKVRRRIKKTRDAELEGIAKAIEKQKEFREYMEVQLSIFR